MAIELERTHDQLADHIGYGFPIPNRISAPGSTTSRRSKLNLPRRFTGEMLSDMQRDRLDVIEKLYAELSDTMSGEGEDHLHQLVVEAREIADREQYIYVTRRRARSASLDPDDRRSVAEAHLAQIARAADNPPPLVREIAPEAPPVPDQRSIAIDLFIDGLLTYHKVDREKLFKAIDTLRQRKPKSRNRDGFVLFATPATGSNQHPIMKAFGKDFPKAVFRLRGDSLETQTLELVAADAANDNDVWTYQASAPTQITLSRRSMLKDIPMHDLERRALSDVIEDPRFHNAIVIDRADRFGGAEGIPLARLKLRPSYAYLQPPGSNAPPYEVQRPSDIRQGDRMSEIYEDLKYANLIIETLTRKGLHQRHRIEPVEGGGLRLRLADPGRTALSHYFEIKRATLHSGAEAISARIDIIIGLLEKQREQKGQPPLPAHSSPPAASPAHTSGKTDLTEMSVVDRFIRLHGAENKQQWHNCDRIDALLSSRLSTSEQEADQTAELLLREGLLAVRTARIAPDIFYRLERFERVLGKISHAIGVLDVERPLTAASIEALRDGNVSQIVKQSPEFGRAQIRKITRTEHGAQITIRVPIHAKPIDKD
jgi:hypothetical protein